MNNMKHIQLYFILKPIFDTQNFPLASVLCVVLAVRIQKSPSTAMLTTISMESNFSGIEKKVHQQLLFSR